TEGTTIEFVSTPKSVYTVTELQDLEDLDDFYESVELRVSGLGKFSLVVDERPTGLIVSGLDGIQNATEGDYTLTIKYNSATIYWSYKVIASAPDPGVTADKTWYTGHEDDSTFDISNEAELYGLAELVNEDGVTFDGKTIRLTENINLTDKVWTPIGEGARKHLVTIHEFPDGTTLDDIEDYVEENHGFIEGGYSIMVDDQGQSYDRDLIPLIDQNYILFSKDNNLLVNGVNTDYVIHKKGGGLYELQSVLDYFGPNEALFMGTFDGQNHTIKGLSDIGYNPRNALNYYVNVRGLVYGYSFGLFGRVSGNVTLKNIKFTDVSITGSYLNFGEGVSVENYSVDSAGALVGFYGGIKKEGVIENGDLTIQNCEVLSGSLSGEDSMGGILGRVYYVNNLTIIDCKNYANITSVKKVGGIGGFITTSNTSVEETSIYLQNLVNYGQVFTTSNTSSSTGGGILTRYQGFYYATVKDCINYGDVTVILNSTTAIGGIFMSGQADIGVLTNFANNFNYGNLKYLNNLGEFVSIDKQVGVPQDKTEFGS
ncbi:MAG TPA: hypothetical protein GX708_05245, partial [Gallicola sp.]|nr:hypothetical protein [Gallicola sp.]